MSYDLCFWIQIDNFSLKPKEVRSILQSKGDCDYATNLPIEAIVSKLKESFPELTEEEGSWCWESQTDTGSFIVQTNPKYIEFNCYDLDSDVGNVIVDILYEFNCKLYDPQIDKRFDG